MQIELKHHFRHTCYDKEKLLHGVNTLSQFMRNLNKQSLEKPDYFESETYKGDGFEALVEALIVLSPVDKRINIVDYKPTPVGEKGVDGVGRTHAGEIHCIQAKYSSDTNKFVTEGSNSIAMFPAFASSYGAKHLTLFTTAKDLHPVLENFKNDNFITHGYESLRKFLDNNEAFWSNFKRLLTT